MHIIYDLGSNPPGQRVDPTITTSPLVFHYAIVYLLSSIYLEFSLRGMTLHTV